MPPKNTTAESRRRLPLAYRIFFLYFEPAFSLLGAYTARFDQAAYLALTDPEAAVLPIPVGTRIALSQFANMLVVIALTEATVLRATSDPRVWRAAVASMLVGDLGHLYT